MGGDESLDFSLMIHDGFFVEEWIATKTATAGFRWA